MTGAPTRCAFVSSAEETINTLGKEPVSLVLIDADKFKEINDTFGHQVGDIVLPMIAAEMMSLEFGKDNIGRLGGEEFGLLLRGETIKAAEKLANLLREKLAGISIKEIGRHPVTVSAGVAELQEEENCASWFRRADQALYRAKRRGRNQVCVAEPLDLVA